MFLNLRILLSFKFKLKRGRNCKLVLICSFEKKTSGLLLFVLRFEANVLSSGELVSFFSRQVDGWYIPDDSMSNHPNLLVRPGDETTQLLLKKMNFYDLKSY